MGNKEGNIFFLKIWNIMLIFGKVFGNHIFSLIKVTTLWVNVKLNTSQALPSFIIHIMVICITYCECHWF